VGRAQRDDFDFSGIAHDLGGETKTGLRFHEDFGHDDP
jgi:hypothetical protein